MPRNFGTDEALGPQEYFVYFKAPKCAAGSKGPAAAEGIWLNTCTHKKGAGRMVAFAPHFYPFKRKAAVLLSTDETLSPESGGQDLAALGTAAGQNLAAVGSSHSLTETVDLGAVTLGGLVGTLHSDTPPKL